MERIQALLKELTLEEKIGMIHGDGLFQTKGVERLGIPPIKMADGPMGVRNEFHNDQWITVGYTDDYVSYLPSTCAIASTWNTDAAYRMGQVLGAEARGRGKDMILAPGINIKRSPACGRNFEYISEDPYLTEEMAVPFIKGIQENDVAACVKHFAVNNQETDRLQVEAVVDERTLREIYYPGFYGAVKRADSYALMGAYNLLKGEHCCQSVGLLSEVLRKEWEYNGVVVSDWGAVHDTKCAAESGLDIEMSVTNNFDEYYMAQPLLKAIQSGEIEEHLIDEKVKHILMMMDKLNMLDGERKTGTYNTPEHRQAILEVAEESVVLLKNENKHLPLSKNKLKKILVVGDNAERIHSNGGGSAEIKALYEISPLMGIKSKLGGNVEVLFSRGYISETKEEESEINWQESSLEQVSTQESTKKISKELLEKRITLRKEAVELAKEVDEVIIVGGLNHDYDTEGKDRDSIELPYEQNELIEEILDVNKNCTVVMQTGSPVAMEKWIDRVQSVVWVGYAGMEGGNALANVLFGEVNPSGKLAETFPKRLEDCPAHCIGEFPGAEKVHYKEGIFVGYRYYDTYNVEPAFCFGHGLSYTDFKYDNLKVEKIETDEIKVSCEITNIGDAVGAEVVQVYVSDIECTVTRPIQELKGYAKVKLDPLETKSIEFILGTKAFRYYSEKEKGFVIENGKFNIKLGSSSRDIRLEDEIYIG